MSDIHNLITKINAASHYSEVFDMSKWRTEYKEWMRQLHPDVCKEDGASDAVAKLSNFKDTITRPRLKDDSGEFTYDDGKIVYSGDTKLLRKAFNNYQELMRLKDEASKHFQKYLPQDMYFDGDQLIATVGTRFVSLSGLKLEEKHVRWVLNRMIGFSAWMNQIGKVHGGLNPESLFIIPENHGMVVSGLYHLTPQGSRMTTISGRYADWYPPSLFTKKVATGAIDPMLAKKTAIYLLGDQSGNGVKLKKDIADGLADYLLRFEPDPYKAFSEYKEYLKTIKSEFFHLNL